MPVVMNGLRRLHASMIAQDMDRYRFEYAHGQAEFDVIFLTDETPYILLLGLRGGAMAFEFKLNANYTIESTWMESDEFNKLVKLLGLRYDPINKFRPTDFLQWVDGAAPAVADPRSKPRASQVFRFRRDVEEANQIYFLKWLPHYTTKSGPSAANLEKTKKLLGYKYYVTCRDHRISSCWTDNPGDEVDATDPPTENQREPA